MSVHASGFLDTQLATTVAFLLDTSVENAQRIINDFRGLEPLDAKSLAIVVDLITTAVNATPNDDRVVPLN